MRKAATRGGESEKDGSGRRYWVHANPAEPQTPSAGGAKRPPKARFLEPYRLTDDCRLALLDCLHAAGVGDPESRDLFATAVEYDIASFRQSCAGTALGAAPQPVCERATEPRAEAAVLPGPTSASPEPPAHLCASGGRQPDLLSSNPSPALMPIAGAARALAGLIMALGPADRSALAAALQIADPFRRGYDGGYLDALCTELERVGVATTRALPPPAVVEECSDRPAAAPPAIPVEAPEPPLSEVVQRFVRRVARVYEQCLEVRPAVDPESPFLVVLRVLAPEAGVRLPAGAGALVQSLKDL